MIQFTCAMISRRLLEFEVSGWARVVHGGGSLCLYYAHKPNLSHVSIRSISISVDRNCISSSSFALPSCIGKVPFVRFFVSWFTPASNRSLLSSFLYTSGCVADLVRRTSQSALLYNSSLSAWNGGRGVMKTFRSLQRSGGGTDQGTCMWGRRATQCVWLKDMVGPWWADEGAAPTPWRGLLSLLEQ